MDHLLALRAFIRIAEAGSFTKAADQMNLPRSSVSRMIQELENHLRTKLFERTTRAVTITPEGAAYHERALRLIADLDDMDATVAAARKAPQGRLRVDLGSVLATRVLIPALDDFRRRYPDIELQIGVGDRAVDLVGDGVDCVIRGGALPDSSLMARRLCELDYVLCATPGYLAGRALPDHPAGLEAGHHIVSYFSASSGKRFPLRFARGSERIEISPPASLSVNDSTAHIDSLLAGLGIGQSFGFLARPAIASGALVELLPDWKPPGHTLHLIWPQSRFANPRLRVFADWVAELFAELDTRPRGSAAIVPPTE